MQLVHGACNALSYAFQRWCTHICVNVCWLQMLRMHEKSN
jgi:hypothetical protein